MLSLFAFRRCLLASSGRTSKEELIAHDMQRLHAMGYAQELYRAMGGFSNFAISFTIISILSGCLPLFGTGMNSAGRIAGDISCALGRVLVDLSWRTRAAFESGQISAVLL